MSSGRHVVIKSSGKHLFWGSELSWQRLGAERQRRTKQSSAEDGVRGQGRWLVGTGGEITCSHSWGRVSSVAVFSIGKGILKQSVTCGPKQPFLFT